MLREEATRCKISEQLRRLRVKALGLYTAVLLEPQRTANKGSDIPSLSHKYNLTGEINYFRARQTCMKPELHQTLQMNHQPDMRI